jgi:hypothetical protein
MLKRLYQADAPLTATGLLMLPVLALAILGLVLDPRMITGAPAWLKPAKFAASIAIYVFTLAWVFTLIPEWKRTRRIVGWATAVAMVLEIAIISIQAYRGTTSHFNVGTLLDGVLFGIMGSVIFAQTITSLAVAVALWRQPFTDRALGWAVRLGMVMTIIGALTGGVMTRPTAAQLADAREGAAMRVVGAHTVGAPDGGPGLPGTGWSTSHGDVRVAHFVGLHGLQVLPLLILATRRKRLPDTVRVRLTLTAAASYFALYGILLAQALRGYSVLSQDPMSLSMFAVWALATAASVWISVVRVGPIRRALAA